MSINFFKIQLHILYTNSNLFTTILTSTCLVYVLRTYNGISSCRFFWKSILSDFTNFTISIRLGCLRKKWTFLAIYLFQKELNNNLLRTYELFENSPDFLQVFCALTNDNLISHYAICQDTHDIVLTLLPTRCMILTDHTSLIFGFMGQPDSSGG